jgi:GMP synthase (glutamine-hydrolysing)
VRVAVFRHVPFETLGLIADVLSSTGFEYDYFDMGTSGAPASISSYNALISMGGPMSANDDLPFLKQEMVYMREAVATGKPVLGICLGSQIIAKALGARVYRNRSKEIGWFPIRFTGAAETDPLFAGLSEPETVFHWHGETFDLPEGAEWLASSDMTHYQAFRYGSNVYGLQFHLEVTPEIVTNWIHQPANSGDVDASVAALNPYEGGDRLAQLAGTVFSRWCDLLLANPA